MMKRVRGSEAGFTLIELLVVVSIISILASLLLPSVSGALAISRSAKCLSNQRGFGTGFSMYASDYNDSLVPITESDPRTVWSNSTHQFKQLGLLSVYIDGKTQIASQTELSGLYDCPGECLGYGYNAWGWTDYLYWRDGSNGLMPWSAHGLGRKYSKTSRNALLTCSCNDNAGHWFGNAPHKAAGNVLFGDGSAVAIGIGVWYYHDPWGDVFTLIEKSR